MKSRSQARTSRFPVNASDSRDHTANRTSAVSNPYEHRSTRTEEPSGLRIESLRSKECTRVDQQPVLTPRSSGPGVIPRQISSKGPDDEQMDVDGHAAHAEVIDAQKQEAVTEDIEIPDSPPYTNGEAQVVLASDGMKDCLALLLTSEMITEINEIGTRFRRMQVVAGRLKRVKWELRSDENMLEYNHDALQDIDDQAQLERIKEEMNDIQRRIAKDKEAAETLEDETGVLTINLAHSRDRLQEILEGTLGRADLLNIPEPESAREIDPAGGPEKEGREPATCEVDTRRSIPNHDNEAAIQEKVIETIRQAARADVEAKREFLISVDEAFDHRQEHLAEQKAEYRQCVREGTCRITQTEFDLFALEDHRKMTADLRDAQDAFEESFKKAKQLGALDERDAHYQESNFSSWSGGYPLSMEHAMVGSAPTTSIAHWQERVERSLDGRSWEGLELKPWSDPDLQPEAREIVDCDLRSVAISDSWSCIDWSRNRKRIDRWRAIAGRER